MNGATSPWPERRRTQIALLGAGAALLGPVALALAGVVALSDTAVVGATTVAAALLIYGLLGWAGNWAEEPADPDAEGPNSEPGGTGAPSEPDEGGPPAKDERDTPAKDHGDEHTGGSQRTGG